MIGLDYLVFYLTIYFEKNKKDTNWSTPLQRTCYAIGLASVALIFSLNKFLIFENFLHSGFEIPKLCFVILALMIMKLYEFIYITKNRYQKIIDDNKFDLDKDIGTVISIFITGV